MFIVKDPLCRIPLLPGVDAAKWGDVGRRLMVAQPYANDYAPQSGEETLGGFVIARGDAPVVLDLVEEPLDAIARPI